MDYRRKKVNIKKHKQFLCSFKLLTGRQRTVGVFFIPYKAAEQQHRYIMNSDYLTSP